MSRIRSVSPLLFAFLLPVAALPAYGRQEVTFTTTADFQKGNPEGLVSVSGNQITRTALNAGPLGAFNQGTSLTSAQIYHSSVTYNGYVYTFGGGISTGPFLADVAYAPVTNGTVGSWNPTQSLPVANRWHASVAYNGYVYVLGGVDVGPTTSATVRMAAFNADGTLAAWTTTTALPSARYGHSAVVYNGRIFVIGGLDGASTLLADAIVAPINADGTLGSWTATTPIPSARHSHGAAAINGFMYVVGGSASFALNVAQLSDVYVSAIASNGTLGAWTAATSCPPAGPRSAWRLSRGISTRSGASTEAPTPCRVRWRPPSPRTERSAPGRKPRPFPYRRGCTRWGLSSWRARSSPRAVMHFPPALPSGETKCSSTPPSRIRPTRRRCWVS